jgi:hypothetical protein
MTDEPKKPEAESKPPVPREQRPLAKAGFVFLPQTWESLFAYAKEIAGTEFVPNDLRGKPGAVLAAWQFGQEIGLAPMAALQSIAVINGRPSLWGDGALAIVRSSPLCEYIHELAPDQALEKGYGECTVKRRDDDVPITRRFTKAMAEQAGLWGGKSKDPDKKKFEPWFLYPGRMLQMRARAWAMRDAIPEALRGSAIREEVEDIEPRDVTPQEEPLRIPEAITKEEASDESKSQSQIKVEGSELAEPARGKKSEGCIQDDTERIRKNSQKENIQAWLRAAPEAEILALKNYLTANLKGLSSQDQIEVIREWAEAKTALLKKTEAGVGG